jgi:hypothetical protein
MKLLQKPQGNDLYAILPGCHAVRRWRNLRLARLREEPGLYFDNIPSNPSTVNGVFFGPSSSTTGVS